MEKINKQIVKEIFYALSLAIFIFSVMEFVHPKIILAYFNLNYLIILDFLFAFLLLSL